MSDAYRKAGVDIDAGDRLVDRIKPFARATARAGAAAALGGFGGLFDLKAAGFHDPLLVAGADGVGTKIKIAIETGRHETIGIDLVAMCVNDVLAQGAEPLFFLDYFATGQLDVDVAAKVVGGIAEGCRLAGCALIGGETAEMPGMYGPGDYDLAGFAVGAVERENVLPRPVEPGDILIGIASSGAHSNGYSLIRKVVADARLQWDSPAPFDETRSLAEALLEPTRIYVRALLPLFRQNDVRGFAHITGGGLTENVPRILSDAQIARFDDAAIELPALFRWLREAGKVSSDDMRRTFNCGIGGVLAVRPVAVSGILDALAAAGEVARVIGDVAHAAGQ